MRLKIGLLDLCAVLLVLVAVFLPGREFTVESAYARFARGEPLPEKLEAIASAQSRLEAAPASGAAADELGRLLAELGQHDQALRVAGQAAKEGGRSAWRAWLAVASAHAERIEIQAARDYAHRALEACRAEGARCPDHEEVRLRLYVEQLDAGVAAMAEGVDPRLEPDKFRQKMLQIHPTATIRAGESGSE